MSAAFAPTVTAPARADVQAIAESLYAEGRRLMAARETAKACAKFDESYQLAPATGALLNLAACNEALGKSATAWAQFRKAEVAARRDGRTDRVKFAKDHWTQLEPTLAYLTIVASPTQATAGLQVSLDDVVLAVAAWNVAIPVDPGPHKIVARLPNLAPQVFPLSIKPHDRNAKVDVSAALTGSSPAPSSPPSGREPLVPPR
jgi:tetratricopeptide (TPR) repeat protein